MKQTCRLPNLKPCFKNTIYFLTHRETMMYLSSFCLMLSVILGDDNTDYSGTYTSDSSSNEDTIIVTKTFCASCANTGQPFNVVQEKEEVRDECNKTLPTCQNPTPATADASACGDDTCKAAVRSSGGCMASKVCTGSSGCGTCNN